MKEKLVFIAILILTLLLRGSISWEAVVGVVSVVGIWFLAGNLYPRDRWFAGIAALFLAISPWYISLPLTASLGLLGVIGGVLILGKFLKGKWLYALVALLVLAGNQVISPFAVNLENAKDSVWLTDQQRREHKEGYNSLISKTFHNKGVNYSLSFVEHWGEHFTADFLFINGNKSLMYLSDLLFLIVGVVAIIKRRYWGNGGVVLVWLAAAPINSVLHFAPPDFIKAGLMVVPLILISSYGAFVLFELIQRYIKGVTIKR